jgi:hypothetical protein
MDEANLSPSPRKEGMGMGRVALVAGSAAMAVLAVMWMSGAKIDLPFGKKEEPVPAVVMLDSVRIIEGAIKQITEKPGITDQQVQAEGERVSKALEGVLASYTSKGVTVLAKGAVIALPAWLDVTDAVAKEIGVDVSGIPSR